MRKKIDFVFSAILVILGAVHIVMTPVFYKVFNLNSLWFAGTGLSFLFLGLMNFIRIQTHETFNHQVCAAGNTAALIYCVLIVIKMTEPQAFISLLDLATLWIFSLMDLKQVNNEHSADSNR